MDENQINTDLLNNKSIENESVDNETKKNLEIEDQTQTQYIKLDSTNEEHEQNDLVLETKDYINNTLNPIKKEKKYGKLFTSGLVLLIIAGIAIMPISFFDFGKISFSNNIFNKRNEAKAKEETQTPLKSSQSESKPKNNIFDVGNDGDYRIPLPDFSWIFAPSKEKIDPSAMQNSEVFDNIDPKINTPSIATNGNKINTNPIPISQGTKTVNNEMNGKVLVKNNIEGTVLTDKFEIGQNITVIYNDKEYSLKVDGGAILGNNTVLIINEENSKLIFGKVVENMGNIVVKAR